MKLQHRLFTGICIALLMQACSPKPQSPDENDISAIQSVLSQQLDQWNQGNIDGFMEGYWNSEELRFSGAKHSVYGFNTILKNYQKSFPNRDDMGNLIFEIDSIYASRFPYVQVEGAWTIHRYDTIGGRFILTFKEIEENKWRIIEDYTW